MMAKGRVEKIIQKNELIKISRQRLIYIYFNEIIIIIKGANPRAKSTG